MRPCPPGTARVCRPSEAPSREDRQPDAGLTEPWSAGPLVPGKAEGSQRWEGRPLWGLVREDGGKEEQMGEETDFPAEPAGAKTAPAVGSPLPLSWPGRQLSKHSGHSLWGALSLEGTLSLSPPWTPGASIPPTWAVRGRRAPSSRWPLWPLMAGLSPVIVTASHCSWSLGRRSTAGPRSTAPESFLRGREGGRSHHPAVASSGAYDHGVQGPERTLWGLEGRRPAQPVCRALIPW